MKIISRIFLFVLCTFSVSLLFSQETCKVFKPEIAASYEGKCKKGVAHGKGIATGIDRYEGLFAFGLPQGYGTYTWANGSKYTGEWIEGMRHGIGRYSSVSNGKDSILDGLWQNDDYIGPKPKNPVVTYNSGVDRYNFQKNQTTKSRVLIDFFQNGTRNLGITNFMMSTTSGSEVKVSQSIGYDFVTFPVTIKLMYTTWNKLHTMPSDTKFEFEISEPGDWSVTIEN